MRQVNEHGDISISSRYQRSSEISDEVSLYWTIREHGKAGTIDLAVSYRLPRQQFQEDDGGDPTSDFWLGFGLTPQGGMVGADMFLYLPPPPEKDEGDTDSNKADGILLDAHGVAYSFPQVDRCGQDWQLVNCTASSTATAFHGVVEVTRALQSHDVNEDLPFLDDSSDILNPTRVIAAWGQIDWNGNQEEANGRRRLGHQKPSTAGTRDGYDGDDVIGRTSGLDDLASMLVPHGPSGRISGSVRFFGDSSTADPADENPASEKFIDLLPPKSFSIPGVETTYKNYCFTLDDFQDLAELLEEHDQVHITGFRDIVGNDAGLVHHMDLHGTTNEILGGDKRLCRTYLDLIHPWEAGSPRHFNLPSEAGIPLGGADGYRAFRVEVHYHNPKRQSGLIDRSGVRLYYTVSKRANEAGLMLLGDYELKLRGTYTVGSARKNSTEEVAGMRHSFYCPPSCFRGPRDGNTTWGITVFREVLHMHSTGQRMTNIHLNSEGSIHRVSEANRFDFSQGAGVSSRANMPYRIESNDSFLSTCYFSQKGNFFGSGSSEEMCQAFLWYYPKQNDRSMSCGYVDATARRRPGNATIDSLDAFGCEMRYDRSEVSVEADFDRLDGTGEQCQDAVFSTRSTDKYSVLDLNFRAWPSLVSLLRSWKKTTKSKEASMDDTNSSKVRIKEVKNSQIKNENCTLCWDGSRPSKSDRAIPGFSWTCDELDAAMPILFTRPELLFLSPRDVAPCRKYQESFGKMCGCAALPDDDGILSRWRPGIAAVTNSGRFVASVGMLLFALILFVLYRCVIARRR